jgi:hypothetical protein
MKENSKVAQKTNFTQAVIAYEIDYRRFKKKWLPLFHPENPPLGDEDLTCGGLKVKNADARINHKNGSFTGSYLKQHSDPYRPQLQPGPMQVW